IRSADIKGLPTEGRDFDPLAALDGGADGLDAYRRIAPEAARLLAPGGTLIMEVGQGQSGDVRGLMAAAGLKLRGPPQADLAGIQRAVAFQKRSR
ncbi:MAG: protein-(glutamine-N5) methyltransferase, release factor-specific, partial [Bradyrhizobium sp.]